MSTVEITVPELGDFDEVDVIEVYVGPGDAVSVDTPLVAVETDKAAMDVPSPHAGRIETLSIKAGDKIAAGDLIGTLTLDKAAEAMAPDSSAENRMAATAPASQQEPLSRPSAEAGPASPVASSAEASTAAEAAPVFGPRVVVLGAGPGGYTAAFRAADLGLDVTLVERWPTLGGVCLNVGCIPSKALLHAAKVIDEAQEIGEAGIRFDSPTIEADQLRGWKDKIIGQLTGGLSGLARQRKVRVVHGLGRFESDRTLVVSRDAETETLEFDQCIIAAGSESVSLPGLPDDPRIIDSTGALELAELPERMLVIGGGIIGLEMATVYAALGVKVSIAELSETLIPGCDRDLVRPLEKRISERYESIMLATRVTGVEADDQGLLVSFDGEKAPDQPQRYGRVLVAVGRKPNGNQIQAEAAGVDVDERGFISVDAQMRTNVPHIFAIGDIVGQPMLAHKATHEGRVAAEVAAGQKSFFDARVIPSVAYTDPEVAWVGLTETEAKAQGTRIHKGVFPWAASGRSLSLGRSEGMTKLIFDEGSGHLLGAGIVGPNAGDLIAEAALAIELGCDAEDISLTIHPHPTLSETLGFAAEVAEGTITDLYIPKR